MSDPGGRKPIYLDHNATTPLDPAVLEAMIPYLTERFGNPSSSHAFGVAARRGVEEARAQVAALIGARPEEIVFTSGGSESNNMVVQGVAAAPGRGGRNVVTSAVDHPSVLEACDALAAGGLRVTKAGVNALGRVDPVEIERAITSGTVLVSVMHANNEVGTIQPIEEIAAAARRRGVPVHTDAAQSAGKIPVNVDSLGVDFLTIAGHKMYGPKGIGALYVRPGRSLPRLIHGAGHETGRRAGTENVPGIVGLGRACEIAAVRLTETAERCRRLRERLHEALARRVADLRRNGDPERSLPNTLNVSFKGIDAARLVAEIGSRVAASPGAACHSGGGHLSAVLTAMGVPREWATGGVRFSLGRSTTEDDVDEAARIVAEAAARRP